MNDCFLEIIDDDLYCPKKSFNSLRIESLPDSECEVCVIVPVRDEAELIEKCLSALAHQVDFNGQPIDYKRYEVIVFANNCVDDSAAIARCFARQYSDFRLHIVEKRLPPDQAYIGRVRQMLMDEAYYRLTQLVGKPGVIASTDGDSQVFPTWIAATLLEIARGADAVGGRIVADQDSCEALLPHIKLRYLRTDEYYQLMSELETYIDANPHDSWPRHAQHYGASLAVTTQMYQQVGGMPAVRTPEDVAFYQALLRVGARFRHSPLVQVTTSARQTVRVEGGFANQLNEWGAMGQQPFLVESADAIETRFRTRQQLRELWQRILNGDPDAAQDVVLQAQTLGVGSDWLLTELTESKSFELLFEQVEQRQKQEGIWTKRWSLVELEQAIADLKTRLNDLRPQPSSERESLLDLER